MPDALYFVVPHGGAWTIKFEDEEYGPYKSQSGAVAFAIDAAERIVAHGESAQIVLIGNGRSLPTRLDLRPGSQPRVLVSIAA